MEREDVNSNADGAGPSTAKANEGGSAPSPKGGLRSLTSSDSGNLVGVIALPWIILGLLLLILPGMDESSLGGGVARITVLAGLAVCTLVYEKWFIDKTRAGVKASGVSPEFTAARFRAKADATAADENERFKRLTQIVDKLQSRIGEEYTDIASRTGWLITGQAFLLTAFVTVLNAERINAGPKQWLTIGIGLAGAIISFVLALSIFYGTALVEALKDPRDDAEALAKTEFEVPQTGVANKTPVHKYSHFATRYIPCLAYVAWVALTLLAIGHAFGAPAPVGTNFMLPPATAATSGRGWATLEASPAFALGAATFKERIAGCPDPRETQRKAQDWLDQVLIKWKARASPSESDVVILVGGADRMMLGADLRRQYDTNMGLARSRAEGIKEALIDLTRGQSEVNKLTSERILVLVTGPRYSPKAEKTTGVTQSCTDPVLAEDRRVQVWLPSGV